MKQGNPWGCLCVVLLFLTLTACGGGGGGGGGSTVSSAISSQVSSAVSSEAVSSAVSSDAVSSAVSSEAVSSAVSSDASSSTSSENSSEPVSTPPDLVDANAQSFIQDQLISLSMNNIGGEALTECSSDLPAGFTVAVSSDASTCEISGEAAALLALTNFTVTAVNTEGSDTALIPIEIIVATPFITTWKTDNDGASEDNQITITTSPEFTYNYNIDWGDGSSDAGVTGDITHTYAIPGEYEISITGRFPQTFFPDEMTDATKLMSVVAWGNRPWLSMNRALAGCENLIIADNQVPNLSRVSDMRNMFNGATDFNSDIGHWDLENATILNNMFRNAAAFNQDISSWNVSNVINMFEMFRGAISFNQPIGTWDVSRTTNLQAIFRDASSFNQDISAWDVSNVTIMSGLIRDAAAFDQNLGSWNIEKVTRFETFANGSGLSITNYNALLIGWSALNLQNNVPLEVGVIQYTEEAEAARAILTDTFGWSITDGGLLTAPDLQDAAPNFYTNNSALYKIENLGGHPDTCTSDDLPLGVSLRVSADGSSCEIFGAPTNAQLATPVIVTAANFSGSDSATITFEIEEETPYITTWKTDNVGASDDNQIIIRTSPNFSYNYNVNWGDGNVDEAVTGDITHTYAVAGEYQVSITGNFPRPFFPNTTNTTLSDSLKLLSVEQWGKRTWLSMENAFFNADNLVINDIESPDLSRVTNMNGMFSNASNFNSDIGSWDVSNVRNMSGMFTSATIFNQPIGNWDTSNVSNMGNMFEFARAFDQDIGLWNVANVTNMTGMFRGAIIFNQNISAWDVSSAQTTARMFREARGFTQDIGSWNVANVVDMSEMFFAAGAFNTDIGTWDVSKVTNMARMFRGAQSFDQNLGSWNVANVTNMSEMFGAGRLSTTNYDATLIGWSQLPNLRNGVNLSAGSTTFSSNAQAARDSLVNDFGWVITDGGLAE